MARALLLAAALVLVTACGGADTRAPFVESRTPPGLASRFLPPDGWAWGYLQIGGEPAQRYGVASPPVAPRGQVLALTGFGESAEAWFETVHELNARGLTVWVLERAGQGGSGRYAARRDLGHAPSLDPDVASVRALRQVVIRPDRGTPFVVIAYDDAAVVVLRAAETGLDADGLVLVSPRWPTPNAARARFSAAARTLGAGAWPAPGWRGWRRDGPDSLAQGLTHDPLRGAVQHAWQTANPDLRMAGPSLGWRAAFAAGQEAAAAQLAHVATPVLILLPDGGSSSALALCRSLPKCETRAVPGAGPALHLERDAQRNRWLGDVGGFIAARGQAVGPS